MVRRKTEDGSKILLYHLPKSFANYIPASFHAHGFDLKKEAVDKDVMIECSGGIDLSASGEPDHPDQKACGINKGEQRLSLFPFFSDFLVRFPKDLS